MDFSGYAIVTDLDGTFLHHGNIVPKNIEAVQYFTANGGIFTIATGRIKETIGEAVPQVERLINAPAVLCNGSYLYDYTRQTSTGETFIDKKDAEALLAFIKKECPLVSWRVSTPRGMRACSDTGYIARDMVAYGKEAFEILPSLDAWPLDDWYKLVFRADWEEKLKIKALFEQHFEGHRLMAVSSGNHFLEVFYRDCHKGEALKKLRATADFSGRTVIACGDFENDMEMLQAADIGICPANALPHVKAVADYVLCDSGEGLMAAVVDAIARNDLKKRV